MILNEREIRHQHVMAAVGQIMTAARTAPKAKGSDIIEIIAIEGNDIVTLAEYTQMLGEIMNKEFMLRDAKNILLAEAVILIGTLEDTQGLNCNYCGFPTCNEKQTTIPCAINSINVGIAIGSICATAADLRIDNRIMFSVGLAAQKMNWPAKCKIVIAIPLSVSSKNPFFDRKK